VTTSQNILVIDDEIDVGNLIVAAAEAMGQHCIATTDPAAFLDALTPTTSLIVLDLMMPGMDGVELLRLLARQECRAGIVLMSGVGNRVLESAEQLAKTLGLLIVGHLNKPFRLKELQAMLTRQTALRSSVVAQSSQRDAVQDDELRNAIARDEFVLHYQPQIEVSTGKVTGVEALARWLHPTRGLISPDAFIAHAEAIGLIRDLSWLIFRRGSREVHQLANGEGKIPRLSLNVSVHSLYDLTFPDAFVALLRENGLQPQNVILEITESGLIRDLSSTLDVLTRLRMKQVQLSIDDFGTGYSMMQQLHNIPATELKIDQSFVQNLHDTDSDRVVVQKTIEIGHELGMKVVAEGVETQDQMEFIRSKGCDIVQGYFYSRPLPIPELLDWLRSYRAIGHS
jgi:EAL domain-containing protein (putative c-di-GMP-specific phosphodiesterase class I)/CheY-like chemotaxis protein